MRFKGYELEFTTAVHFGRQKLDDAERTIYADTIFSAMCHEALGGGTEELDKLTSMVRENRLRISDAFPYGTAEGRRRYYVPRPMAELNIESSGDSSAKKKLKKLEYIPWSELSSYLEGSMDIEKEAELLSMSGKRDIRTMASVPDRDDTLPYPVGTYTFADGWGLYIMIGYEDEQELEFIENLLIGIGYTGIGGKRSAGLGKFVLKNAQIAGKLLDTVSADSGKAGLYMTMSLAMPEERSLDDALDGARYALVRRAGFISSANYTDRPVKKKESYLLKSGSVFKRTFDGELLDVSGDGSHPVWRYAMPLFLEVK